ncbi:unnamed protein product [Nezara viridula]|uniref:Uncharacterized protein n=1 Tax=Nezara viridula TaxID=85310 RepID=A0A9P0H600_NEZVI|nr:unnamed protein product [Nezara viridula]
MYKFMGWYPREHVRKIGRPPTDWDKEMKKTCGGTAWKRVALERKEWKRMGQVHYLVWLQENSRLCFKWNPNEGHLSEDAWRLNRQGGGDYLLAPSGALEDPIHSPAP